MRARASLVLVALLAASGCHGPGAARADLLTIQADWEAGRFEEDSMARLRAAVAALGEVEPDNYRAQVALQRLSVTSPSELVRADALRAAWRLASHAQPEPFRADEVDHVDFNARAERLDALLDSGEAVPRGELEALIEWIGGYRFPPGRMSLAVDLGEAVASRAVAHAGTPVGDAFSRHAGASLRHALVLVTLHSAGDSAAVVREEAASAARHMDPEAALRMLAGMLARESDSQVIFRGLDALHPFVGRIAAADLQQLLAPLASSPDVAVRHRARALLDLVG